MQNLVLVHILCSGLALNKNPETGRSGHFRQNCALLGAHTVCPRLMQTFPKICFYQSTVFIQSLRFCQNEILMTTFFEKVSLWLGKNCWFFNKSIFLGKSAWGTLYTFWSLMNPSFMWAMLLKSKLVLWRSAWWFCLKCPLRPIENF